MPSLPGLDHFALTVTDVEKSAAFYAVLLGVQPSSTMNDGPFVRRKFTLAGGLGLGLTEHRPSEGLGTFDEQNPGLDHVGFSVAGIAQLEEWEAHLDSMGVQHSGLITASYGTVLSFKDPDGVALEFFAPAQAPDPSA
ncbi:VOC family protein [Pseudarthrobacter sp. NamE5]|uniref:VOC family protein n=1 Tax=Pseudarthrobacter sp. NamE5 TaxID=2576839 RepID=UPI00110B4799|nr:VOC family protein [Pseudarthrobacter sp. NamE5]TLM80915.1 VOC family protein [Pseudarthrobacter sp. NamE5]